MKLSLDWITAAHFRGVSKPITLDFRNLEPGLLYIAGRNDVEPRLGSNGAGKSTLLSEAISWALQGRTARSKRPGSAIENWEDDRPKTFVEVALGIDDQREIIKRTRNPNDLLLNNKKVEQEIIDALLPLSDMALKRSILIDQFADLFLNLGPEDKSRLFSETLDLDKWLRAADKAGIKIRAIEQGLHLLEADQASYTGSLSEARERRTSLDEQQKGFEEDIKRQIAEARDTLRIKARDAKDAAAMLDKAREALGRIDKDDVKRDENSLVLEVRRNEAAFATVNARQQSCDRELRKLDERIKAYSADAKLCPECGQPVTDAHRTENLKKLRAERKKLEATKQTAIEQCTALVAQQATLEKKLDRLREQLVEFDKAQEIVSQIAGQSLILTKEVNSLREKIEELEERKNPYDAELKRLAERIRELRTKIDDVADKLEEGSRLIEIYSFWQTGFREIRLEQIDTALAELEIATNRHAEALGFEDWYVEFATERETKKGTVSHGFTVLLYPPGKKEPQPGESYSGGEFQRLQLAITFALSEILLSRAGIETDFEILDEPTTSLSDEGIDDLLECLHERARTLNRRILMIDHQILDRGSFDGSVTVVKSKRGIYLEDPMNLLTVSQKKKERVRL